MSAQADFEWWRKAVETEWDRSRLIGCGKGIFASRPPISREITTAPGGEHLSRLGTVPKNAGNSAPLAFPPQGDYAHAGLPRATVSRRN